MKVPVAICVFNRPQLTARVFEMIRALRPAELFIIADGPRADRSGDPEKCEQVRAIFEKIDWPCEVRKNFSETNLGCARRMASGIDWLFSLTERAIILEDDCVPQMSFYRFCDELLKRYETAENIFVISGDNFQDGKRRSNDSYYFSAFNHCWGWASWRRAWSHFDFEMTRWPQLKKENWLATIWKDRRSQLYWEDIFDRTYTGKIDSWANRWLLACWIHHGLTVLPERNLVTNIGFGEDSTNTGDVEASTAEMKSFAIDFPLRHPTLVQRNYAADQYTQNAHISSTFLNRFKRKLILK